MGDLFRMLMMLVLVSLVSCVSAHERREAHIKSSPGISESHRALIRKGRITHGMTWSDVEASLGKPSRKNRSAYRSVTKDQWVYRRGNGRSMYVYFEDGFVTSWQGPAE